MAMSFEEFKKRLIKSGKKVIVSTRVLGKTISTTIYNHGKKVSQHQNVPRHSNHKYNHQVEQVENDYYSASHQATQELNKRYPPGIVRLAKLSNKALTERAENGDLSPDEVDMALEYKAEHEQLTSGYQAAKQESRYISKRYSSKKVDAKTKKAMNKEIQRKAQQSANMKYTEIKGIYNSALHKVSSIKTSKVSQNNSSQSKPNVKESHVIAPKQSISLTNLTKGKQTTSKRYTTLNSSVPTPRPPQAEINVYNPLNRMPSHETYWDKAKDYEKKGLNIAMNKAREVAPVLTTSYVEPVTYAMAGVGMGALEFGKDLGNFVAHPVSSTKRTISAIGNLFTHPKKVVKSVESLGAKEGAKLQSGNLQSVGYDIGKFAGYTAGSELFFKGIGKGMQKISEYAAPQKVTRNYKVKKVMPHTQEYKIISSENPISQVKININPTSNNKKYAILKSTTKEIKPINEAKYMQKVSTHYDVLTRKQLQSFAKQSSRKGALPPSKYRFTNYEVIDYTNKPNLPKSLKPNVEITEHITVNGNALRSPYIHNFRARVGDLLSENKRTKSLLKKGVYYEHKTVSFTRPSSLSRDVGSFSRKVSGMMKSKRASSMLRTETKPIQIGFKGSTSSILESETIMPLSTASTKALSSFGSFASKAGFVAPISKASIQLKGSGYVAPQLSRNHVKVGGIVGVIPKTKVKSSIINFTKTIPQVKVSLKSNQLMQTKTKTSVTSRQLEHSITGTKTRTSISSFLQSTTTSQTQRKSHIYPSQPHTPSLALPYKLKRGLSFTKKSKKSKSYKKWLKQNPWANVRRVRL